MTKRQPPEVEVAQFYNHPVFTSHPIRRFIRTPDRAGYFHRRCYPTHPRRRTCIYPAIRYNCDMIESFADRTTEAIYDGKTAKGFPSDFLAVARRKLDMLRRASTLQDLRVPPGNRLEALKGDLAGFHSIRINDQWRIVFQWSQGSAHQVRIVDCH